MTRRTGRWLALGVAVATCALTSSAIFAADDSVSTARNLYAAASYEDALALLDKLHAASSNAPDGTLIQEYRAFCLLALGREPDAVRVIEDIVTAQPSFQPADGEMSPHVRSVFRQVRQRVLPRVSQQAYAEAKATFDRKEYESASAQFTRVLDLLADADLADQAGRAPLSDLRALATGFRDLSVANTPPPPPPPPPAPEAPAVPPRPHIYGGNDANVVSPVAIRQSFPAAPRGAPAMGQLVVDVIIDESGAVEIVSLRGSLGAAYDAVMLETAKDWRYKPATLDGKPVKYRKLIQVTLKPAGAK
jgi:TonB family protein